MEALTLSLSAAALLGLVFGAGPCNVTCLPYLGPVFLSERIAPWRTVAWFSIGRLTGYTSLGAVAGAAGQAATAWLANGPAAWILGAATVGLGIVLLGRRSGRRCALPATTAEPVPVVVKKRRGAPQGLSLALMGAAMALNPCVPLGTVLLAAGASGRAVDGATLGLAFGVGAVLVPSLLFAVAVAHFGTQVRAHLQRWGAAVERGAGVTLVILGTMTAFGWVSP